MAGPRRAGPRQALPDVRRPREERVPVLHYPSLRQRYRLAREQPMHGATGRSLHCFQESAAHTEQVDLLVRFTWPSLIRSFRVFAYSHCRYCSIKSYPPLWSRRFSRSVERVSGVNHRPISPDKRTMLCVLLVVSFILELAITKERKNVKK